MTLTNPTNYDQSVAEFIGETIIASTEHDWSAQTLHSYLQQMEAVFAKVYKKSQTTVAEDFHIAVQMYKELLQ